MGIIRVTIWVIGVINLLIKSPDPSSNLKSSEKPCRSPGFARVSCFEKDAHDSKAL